MFLNVIKLFRPVVMSDVAAYIEYRHLYKEVVFMVSYANE